MLTSGCSRPGTARKSLQTQAYTLRTGTYIYMYIYIYIHMYVCIYIYNYRGRYSTHIIILSSPVAVVRQVLLKDGAERRLILGDQV